MFKKLGHFFSDHKKVETLKNIIEISAILIGGIWAFFYFNVKDKEELEKAADLSSTIRIDSLDRDRVYVNFAVQIKNIGKVSFDVDTVVIRYCKFPLDSATTTEFFSPEKYFRDYSANLGWIDDSALLGHFAPGTAANQTFNFFFKKSKDSCIMIQADLATSNKTWLFIKQSNWDYTYDIKWRCLPTKESLQVEKKE